VTGGEGEPPPNRLNPQNENPSEPSDRLPEELRISKRRAKQLGAKLLASPFLPAFAATKLVETMLPRSPLAWVVVFTATTGLFVLGHQFLQGLQTVQELADSQTQLPDYGGDDAHGGAEQPSQTTDHD
jgi:hypothetical protein